MQHIPVHLLYSFVVFAEAESVSEAATQIGVTQPALSKQLKALEQTFPQPLFATSGKRKVLTPFGRRLHADLKARLSDLQDVVRQSVNHELQPFQAQVRIHARREVLDRIVDRISFPGKLIFTEGSHQEILFALKNRKSDLGITHAVPETHDFIARPLFREKFRLVIPKSLVPRNPAPRELGAVLREVPCLAYNEQDEVLQRACENKGIDFSQLRMSRLISDYSAISKMLQAGLGWAVIPVHFPISVETNWCVELPAPVFNPREFQSVYRSEITKAPFFRGLMSEITACFRS